MSSETKFSKGPWEINSYANYEGFSVAAKGRGCIAERWWPARISDDFNPEAMANARLIAAAPDLYETLKNLRSWYATATANHPDDSVRAEILRQVDEQLSRARGEEPAGGAENA